MTRTMMIDSRALPCGLYRSTTSFKTSSPSKRSDDPDDSTTAVDLSLSNVSKIILPPLGVSGYNQNDLLSKHRIITPMNSKYRCWETLMVALVAYSAWVYPFEVAFMKSCPKSALFIADNIVNLFFAIDIILTFFVAYIDSRTQLLVHDSRKIALRYLSTWFVLDVASTTPYEALAFLFTGKYKVSLSYSLLGLFRFWRLRRVKQFFTRLEKDIRFSYFWVRCARLLFVTLFLVHCAGCLYYLLADRYPHEGKTWIGAMNPNFRETSHWRSSIESASSFVSRNRLPPRLKEQILGYMCLRFKAESLNQFQLIEQLPNSIYKNICQHLFLPTVQKVYLFNGVSRETLLVLVASMKAEYLPPREDIIMQNEAPEDIYIIVSGEVEMIDYGNEKEYVVGSLQAGEMFGEIAAICSTPQSFTFRTKTLAQLLRLKTSSLIQTMKMRQEDNIAMVKNFLQHHRKLKFQNLGDWLVEHGDEDGEGQMALNLLHVAATGNSTFLDKLLNAKLDPNICDSKGRTPLHEAAIRGHEECVVVLLNHGCNAHLRDASGNTALWDAIAAKQHTVFRLLHNYATISNPHLAGDLLCTAAERNDILVMTELLKHGLNVDSKNYQGLRAIDIALTKNHEEIAKLLVAFGARTSNPNIGSFDSMDVIEELLQEKDMLNNDMKVGEIAHRNWVEPNCVRVNIFKGHPNLIKEKNNRLETGKLMRLPSSIQELKKIAGEKFKFNASNALIVNEEGAEVDSIEMIRDNDKLFLLEDPIL